MAKLMIASDIHGAAGYCKQLIERFEEEKADRLILLGDILYHGPRNDLPDGYAPKKVIELLNNIKDRLMCVRGNCDTEVDQMVLEFPMLADYAILYNENKMLYLTHGHHINPDNIGNLREGDVLISGHTHIPVFEERNGILCINPGSVSIPKENSERGYIILEKNSIKWKNLFGNTYREENL